MPLIGDKLYTEDLSLFGRFKDQCPTQEDFDYLMLNRHALHALSIKLPKYLNSPDLFISEIPVEFIHWIKTYFKIDQTKLENSLKENINHVFSSNILSNN
jgi:hypothetical protein